MLLSFVRVIGLFALLNLIFIGFATTSQAAPAHQVSATYTYETQWAKCQYQVTEKKQQAGCFSALITQLREAAKKAPDNPNINTLLAINIASLAGVSGVTKALGLIKEAKGILEEVIKKHPHAMHGAPYVTLGALYYRAPGWPISFGNDDKAKTLLEEGLKLNPYNSTTNYFYADFLAEQGEKQQAIIVLKKTLTYPSDPDYPVTNAGRKKDIETLLNKLQGH
ncbi:hypothetical protein F9817_02895 [Vibrio sp. CAIM 722]|uniref:TPR repeats containing protein n=1 Tax=Vibrio eleionomae TaxID=2653505 RepID=A0A7X4RT73_9VIBR|nr:tetratricopeptide repeat protein [Vibrio eleionomae]MZI92153.1 hypothetical protein [Vibrio eleionomae]